MRILIFETPMIKNDIEFSKSRRVSFPLNKIEVIEEASNFSKINGIVVDIKFDDLMEQLSEIKED